jgi:uncharacterized LabA/DUF88 family protein
MEDSYKNIVVLVDADNAQVGMMKSIIEDVAKYGRIAVKEAFGDWSSDTLKSWPSVLLDLGFHSIQQFAYTKQKNASDIELVISAMDLITNPKYDLYVLVSSDSDFTPLAIRLKESGASVYGYGEKKTPNPFVQSCDRFFYTENLISTPANEENKASSKDPGTDLSIKEVINKLIFLSDSSENEDGWVSGAVAGNYLVQISPSFSPKVFKHRKFADLVKAYPEKFETQLVSPQDGGVPQFFYRNKK